MQLSLVHSTLHVQMQELDRVLDRDDVFRSRLVDLVDDRGDQCVDLPEPVGPVTRTMPFFSEAASRFADDGMFNSSSVGMLVAMTRITIA